MEDWSRQRARQEREMMANAASVEARRAHLGLFNLHLRACPQRNGSDPFDCLRCDLRADCGRLLDGRRGRYH